MARSSNVTIRDGTSERNWHFLAAYVAMGVFVVGVIAYTFSQGGSLGGGILSGVMIMLVSVIGLATYPALFRDSAYVRDTRRAWKPKWWYYLLGGLGTPVVFYAILQTTVTEPGVASVGAIVAHALSASIISALYLYRRHQYLGVP